MTTSSFEVPSPRETYDCIGHEVAEQQVLSTWLSGRMHHAWLITGPRGIGKATFAYRIARFLLTHGEADIGPGKDIPKSLYVSPESPGARRIAIGSHGDLKVLEREWNEKRKRFHGEILVDAVRDVGRFLSLTPSEGGWRVVIVDAADEMNSNSANGFLKILEEPPRQAILILLAHNPARVLPTIRSRCRVLSLAALPQATVNSVLLKLAPDVSCDDRHTLASLGEGSVGRAIDLAQQGGLGLYQTMIGLLRSLPRTAVTDLHVFAEKAAQDDDAFRVTTDLLRWWLSRMIAGGARQEEPEEALPGENGVMRVMWASAPLDRWVEVWEKIGYLFERTDAVNLDRKQALLSAFSGIARLVHPR